MSKLGCLANMFDKLKQRIQLLGEDCIPSFCNTMSCLVQESVVVFRRKKRLKRFSSFLRRQLTAWVR